MIVYSVTSSPAFVLPYEAVVTWGKVDNLYVSGREMPSYKVCPSSYLIPTEATRRAQESSDLCCAPVHIYRTKLD